MLLTLLLCQDPVSAQAKLIWNSKKDTVWRVEVIREGEWRHNGTAFVIQHGIYQYVVTCAHVIEGESQTRITNGILTKEIRFQSVKDMDAAISRVKDFKSYSKLSFVQPEIGDKAYTMGFPGRENLTIGEGLVNRFARQVEDYPKHSYLGISSSIWFGNSGGPVFNEGGDVVGISSNITSGPQHLNYAVNTGTDFRNALMEYKETK
jgi:serine protease Do